VIPIQRRRFLSIFPIGPYVKTMSTDGGHLGWSFGSLDIILKVDHLRTIHAMFASETTKRFEPNLAEMFIGWSYTRFVFLVLIGNPTWLPGPIMCSDWSKF
jgi:hypothetical protein